MRLLAVRGGTGVVGLQEDVAQAHEGDVGGNGEHARGDDERLADPQPAAHRGAQAPQRGLAGAGPLGVAARSPRSPLGSALPRGWGAPARQGPPALRRNGCGLGFR
ncbi:lipoprotein [Actinomyces denticolens]|nr:lipoprotein [Actinomyces denticolens]